MDVTIKDYPTTEKSIKDAFDTMRKDIEASVIELWIALGMNPEGN